MVLIANTSSTPSLDYTVIESSKEVQLLKMSSPAHHQPEKI